MGDVLKIVLVVVALLLSTGFNFMAAQKVTQRVPALLTFGDSFGDVGNNNYILTVFKSYHPPYGRDFPTGLPTGRASDGKLIPDVLADLLGFKTYPPAYLSPEASGLNLLHGANFASGASGLDNKTPIISPVIHLPQQFKNFKEYQRKLAAVAGSDRAASIIKQALYFVTVGINDLIANYNVNPVYQKIYTIDQYTSFLASNFRNFIKDLHSMGATKIGVLSVLPAGCLPLIRTTYSLFLTDRTGCVSRINMQAKLLNEKINSTVVELEEQLPGLKLVIFDYFNPILDFVADPKKYGFTKTARGCCGTGTIEVAVLCNFFSIGTCNNASNHVFWDSIHPTEATYQILVNRYFTNGINRLVG